MSSPPNMVAMTRPEARERQSHVGMLVQRQRPL